MRSVIIDLKIYIYYYLYARISVFGRYLCPYEMANYLPEDCLTVLSCSCPRCVLCIFFQSPSNSQQSYLRSDSAYVFNYLQPYQYVSENMRNDHFCRSRPIDKYWKNYYRDRKISFLIDWFMTYRHRSSLSRQWNFENRW